MKKIFVLSAMAALVLSGCSKGEDEFSTPSNQMQFVAEYPTTRATTTNFEDLFGFIQQFMDQAASHLSREKGTPMSCTKWKT